MILFGVGVGDGECESFGEVRCEMKSDPAGTMESKWAILDDNQALRHLVGLKLDPARQSAWRHTCKQAGAALGSWDE